MTPDRGKFANRARMAMRRGIGKVNACVAVVCAAFALVYACVCETAFAGRARGVQGRSSAEWVFRATTAIAGAMYACTVMRDPGRVPVEYEPNVEDDGGGVVETKKKGGGRRFCQKCERYKPPRTHHCRVCKRCVLRMDHHCVWVNNCVGHYNYKSFFLFLAYTTLALTQATYHLGVFARDEIFSENGSAANDLKTTTVAMTCLVVTFALNVALAFLFLWHVRLVINNKTTIEHYEGVTAKHSNIPQIIEHPYSLGVVANLREILGRNIILWFAPGCKISGDGTRFASILEMGRVAFEAHASKREGQLSVI